MPNVRRTRLGKVRGTGRAYDPRTDPDPAGWLATEESDRIQAVLTYHKRARIRVPSERLHATIHVIVENQLALGVPEVVDALVWLQRDGLNRHDAVHAIGSVLAEHIYDLLKQGPTEDVVSHAAYFESLKKLTAAGWRGAGRHRTNREDLQVTVPAQTPLAPPILPAYAVSLRFLGSREVIRLLGRRAGRIAHHSRIDPVGPRRLREVSTD